MKKVFLEDLPKRGNTIDWKKSVGLKVYFTYNNINDYVTIVDYVSMNNILVRYKDKEMVFNTSTFKRCPFGSLLGVYIMDHIYEKGDIIDNSKSKIKILEKIRYGKGNGRGYKYVCLDCGNEDMIFEYQIKKGVGCNVCTINPRKALVGVNDISTTAPWLVDYLFDKNDAYKYTQSSGKSIKFKCPVCGDIRTRTIDKVYQRGFSCISCGDGFSIPFKFMTNILKESNIKFKTEYSPEWCSYEINGSMRTGRYDFYIPSKKIIIETDGAFHKIDNSMNGQTKEESGKIDKIKDNLAFKNGIEVIRIDCSITDFDYMKANIEKNKRFREVVNIDSIDLQQCYIKAQGSNLVDSCDMWNKNTFSIKDIAKTLGIDRTTVRRYLKEGMNLGICDYTVEKSKEKVIKNRKGRKVSILCVNNGVTYESIKNLMELSESHFGVKLERGRIIDVCRGRRDNYKGLIFEYKNGINSGLNMKNEIICINDGVIFKSYDECLRYYMNAGHNISKRNISDNCRNISRKTKCGLIFKYVSDLTEEEKLKYNIIQ